MEGRNANTDGGGGTARIKTGRESRDLLSISYFNSPGPQVQLSHSVFPLFLVPHGMAKQEERLE